MIAAAAHLLQPKIWSSVTCVHFGWSTNETGKIDFVANRIRGARGQRWVVAVLPCNVPARGDTGGLLARMFRSVEARRVVYEVQRFDARAC